MTAESSKRPGEEVATPRTDAQLHRAGLGQERDFVINLTATDFVKADFARQLERELIAAAPLDEECMGLMREMYEMMLECAMDKNPSAWLVGDLDKLNEKLHFKE